MWQIWNNLVREKKLLRYLAYSASDKVYAKNMNVR